jgi:hypothetical protein
VIENIEPLIARLEEALVMLSDEDQVFVNSSRMAFELGALTPNDIRRLQQLAAKLQLAEHNNLGEGPALTLKKVLADLATADKMLSREERTFVQQIIAALRVRKLNLDETEALLRLHARQGF